MTNAQVNFRNFKNWLTKNEIDFEKGYSEHEDDFGNTREKHDFVILKNYDIQIYDDKETLTMDFGDAGFTHFYSNREIYKEFKMNIVR